MILNLILWAVGIGLLLGGVFAIRRPAARYRELRETDANLRRYDSWRGGRRAVPGEITGADVMRQQLSQRVRLLSLVIVAGIVLIVAGFLIR